MLPKKFHIILLLLWVWNFTFGQQYTQYTVKDGLPSNHVYKITQDLKGFIWIITDTGISKFNGKTFKNFTTQEGLPINDNWDITITPDNRVWYFSKSNILGYIENDKVFAFPNEDEKDILFPAAIIQFGNKIIIGHTQWHIYTNEKWTGLDPLPTTNNVLPAKPITKKEWQTVEIEKAIQLFYSYENRVAQLPKFKTSNLKRRGRDSIILWLYDEGYSVFNLNTNNVIHKPLTQRNSLTGIERFHFVNNQIQITGNNYVALLDENYEITPPISIPEAFGSHFSMIDKTGNLWMATFNNGLYMLPQVKRLVNYSLPSEKVSSFQKVGEHFIASVQDKGFYKFDSLTKTFQPLLNETGYIYQAVRIDSLESDFYTTTFKIIRDSKKEGPKVLVEDFKESNLTGRNLVYFKGYLYGSASALINKLDPNTLKISKQYRYVGLRKLISFKNQLILATSDGLKKLENDTIIPIHFNHNTLQKSIVNVKEVTPELLLVMTDGFGAYLTNLKTTTFLKGTEFLVIQDAFIENKTIWIASDHGILKFIEKHGDYILEKKYDESDGLPARICNSVAIANKDILVGTDNGAAVFSKSLEKEPQWLGVYIEKASFNNQIISQNNNQSKYVANNTLSFDISSINYFEGTTQLAYQYKLAPIQTEWISSSSGTLNFTDLSPNHYRLDLKANHLEEAFEFTILPLWWQKTVTKIAAISLLLGLFFFILHHIRKKELTKKTAKLNAQKKMAEYELYALRSQMNPHFVFNSLTAIQYYINENDFENSEKYLVKFSKLIRQFFEISKQEEITLEAEIKLLQNYLEIEKLRFKDKLTFTIEVAPKLDINQSKIPTMLLQPVVENAVNHGIFNKEANGTIFLTFSYLSPNAFKVEIMDDGVGFEKTKNHKHGKISSSIILKDRIAILNESQRWDISYASEIAFSEAMDKGNKATFVIKSLS